MLPTPEEMAIIQKHEADETAKKLETYKRLNKLAQKGQILFTGSSLMEQFPITEMAMSHNLGKVIYNRGIGGFKTTDFLANIDTMLLDLEPKYVFINIGTNDLANLPDGTPWQTSLEKHYDLILGQLKSKLPKTEVYMMAYYPMDEANEEMKQIAKLFGATRTNATLAEANAIAKGLSEKYGYHFIDVNDGLTDEAGNLKRAYCKDAIHFYPDGYEIVYKNLEKYLVALS